jgi:hypothetical protein
MKKCLNCKKTEREIPLVSLHYQGLQIYICSECFPTLIHTPEKLAVKLEALREIEPAEHED